MIQLSREVNKPNSFISSKNNRASTTIMSAAASTKDLFPTKEQMEYSREMARRKQNQESKIMIDTREKFTKRYQFDKLSHQMVDKTTNETQLSGSAHNKLARYDSKTIFRTAHRDPTAEHVPSSYAHLLGTDSLPNLTRNSSASGPRKPLTRKNSDDMDQLASQLLVNKPPHGKRNKRPFSSTNAMRSSFWKTAKRQLDGQQVVVMAH